MSLLVAGTCSAVLPLLLWLQMDVALSFWLLVVVAFSLLVVVVTCLFSALFGKNTESSMTDGLRG